VVAFLQLARSGTHRAAHHELRVVQVLVLERAHQRVHRVELRRVEVAIGARHDVLELAPGARSVAVAAVV
jgi:hypothetical protein